ncbi:MAG: hypothetical protein COA78_01845 [Blastopirellula sp.]|nr:MAG: hypothetical protein COA78_01845 [Blastopirellula sp.]
MEAIAELIIGLISLLFEFVILLVQLVFMTVFMILEFIVLWFTKGKEAARNQYQQRKEERKTTEDGSQSNQNNMESKLDDWNVKFYIFGTVVLMILGMTAAVSYQEQIQIKRIEQTEQQIAKIADELFEQIKNDEAYISTNGWPRKKDVWSQPLELQVDEQLLGTKITVRSSGPDREFGTEDDLQATRMAQASAKEVGGELLKRGVKSIKQRLSDFLEKAEVP